jgi:hypothetical protein
MSHRPPNLLVLLVDSSLQNVFLQLGEVAHPCSASSREADAEVLLELES